MGCVFCASGVAGLKRHMRADEIVAQVLVGRVAARSRTSSIRNVVLMGMGEPLHNYDATVRALRLLTHPDGIALSTPQGDGLDERPRAGDRAPRARTSAGRSASPSRFTPPTTRRARASCRSTRSTRSPVLMAGAPRLPAAAPAPHHDRVHARRREERHDRRGAEARAAPPRPAREDEPDPDEPDRGVDARPAGPQRASSRSSASSCDAGYSCFIRRRRGDDVSAACGQLALLGAKPKVRVNRS